MIDINGQLLPIGTKIKLIDSGSGPSNFDGCSAVFGSRSGRRDPIIVTITDKKHTNGLGDSSYASFNVMKENGEVWGIHKNAKYEIVELVKPMTSLPENYWIHNDGDSDEFARIFNKTFEYEEIIGSSNFYGVSEGKASQDYEDTTELYPEWPVYSFAEWKNLFFSKEEPKVEQTFQERDVIMVLDTPYVRSWLKGDQAIGHIATLNQAQVDLLNDKKCTAIGDNETAINYYADDISLVSRVTPAVPITSAHKNNTNNFSSTINQQSKPQQNETNKSSSGSTISDSIEQCIIRKGSSYRGTSTYVSGDQERITKGQRREGVAIRG
jgi:hypothetical protein